MLGFIQSHFCKIVEKCRGKIVVHWAKASYDIPADREISYTYIHGSWKNRAYARSILSRCQDRRFDRRIVNGLTPIVRCLLAHVA